MQLTNELVAHEAGHLVIGLLIGIDEQGIAFRPPGPGQAAGAWCKHLDRDLHKAIIRSFSGLLSHFHLIKDSIAPDLRRAYAHSIVIDPEHPNYHEINQADREFLSGAKDDIAMAWSFALRLKRKDQNKALEHLRSAENEAKALIEENATNILSVMEDIHEWSGEPDREYDFMLLYPPRRAVDVIRRSGG